MLDLRYFVLVIQPRHRTLSFPSYFGRATVIVTVIIFILWLALQSQRIPDIASFSASVLFFSDFVQVGAQVMWWWGPTL
ncbi:hypothetical protein V1505DRAFT_379059 [Lipomyces doorenjongii]